MIGLLVLTVSMFYLYSVITYSPENTTLITPGKTEDFFLLNYSFYISDFLLQAFGVSCILSCLIVLVDKLSKTKSSFENIIFLI